MLPNSHTKWLPVLLAAIFISVTGTLSAQVVLRKPTQPVQVLRKPERDNPNQVWMPATWRWSDRKHAYEWRPGHWVERKGKKRTFQQGRWVAVRKGFKWEEGKWVK